jgi:hypothetical protein
MELMYGDTVLKVHKATVNTENGAVICTADMKQTNIYQECFASGYIRTYDTRSSSDHHQHIHKTTVARLQLL